MHAHRGEARGPRDRGPGSRHLQRDRVLATDAVGLLGARPARALARGPGRRVGRRSTADGDRGGALARRTVRLSLPACRSRRSSPSGGRTTPGTSSTGSRPAPWRWIGRGLSSSPTAAGRSCSLPKVTLRAPNGHSIARFLDLQPAFEYCLLRAGPHVARARPGAPPSTTEAHRRRVAQRGAGALRVARRCPCGRNERVRSSLAWARLQWTQDELTASERRAAELAVSGQSNKEIAASLFISVHTVERHLSSAQAKFGVRS